MLSYYLQLLETEEDRQLFAILYEEHKKQMHYVANQVLRNDGLAEDAVHNAFEGVARNFHALYGRSAEDRKNYLLKAATNAAYNLTKKERRHEDYCKKLDGAPVSLSALEELCSKLQFEAIVAAIKEIPEPYNTVLYCHIVMELDHKEIAQVLHRKPDAVRQQLHRGKKALQKKLMEVQAFYV